MCPVLLSLAEPISVQFGQRDLWAHQNDQFLASPSVLRAAEHSADVRDARKIRNTIGLPLLVVFNQSAEDNR